MAKHKKTADEITPAILIHPGEMIKDELEARGMTQKDLANKLGISYTVRCTDGSRDRSKGCSSFGT